MEILDCRDHCVQHHRFAAVIFVLCKTYKHFEISYFSVVDSKHFKVDYLETLIRNVEKEIEILEGKIEDYDGSELEGINILHNYTRRFHCGLILNGGFVEHEVPSFQTIISYDVLGELKAGNCLARRSLEDMQATEGQYWGHQVMLQAATDGTAPSEGPLNRMFKGHLEAKFPNSF